ncbi:MAG: SsrA-binding protein SmpB [Gammaproteobacteria bacterium]
MDNTITLNRKALHHYFIEQRFEAGIVLEGWEVKSIRAGRVQIAESHIIFKHGAPYLIGTHITPLQSASTHINPDPTRTRKLLLNAAEISKLIGSVERKGYTLVPLSLYWKKGHVKVEVGLARGKKQYDKRASEKQRDWNREKARLLKKS